MICIICKEEKTHEQFGREHIIPDSIGGRLTLGEVCISCNSELGSKIDKYLTDHKLIQFIRNRLEIPGKGGKVPVPFTSGTITSGVFEDSIGTRIRFHYDSKGKHNRLYAIPTVTDPVVDEEGKHYSVTVDKSDRNELANIVNKILKRSGRSELPADEILAHATDLLEPVPKIEVRLEIDRVLFQSSVLKIAYEIGYYWLGDRYLNDRFADSLRRTILENAAAGDLTNRHGIRANIDLVLNYSPSLNLWNDEPDSHILFLKDFKDALWCYVRIFSAVEGCVMITDDLATFADTEFPFIAIDPATGNCRSTSLSEEEKRVGRPIDISSLFRRRRLFPPPLGEWEQ
jgi:hypothetical protein